MINVKPKLIYLGGCVARIQAQLEANTAEYEVLNGEWRFIYDFDKNQTVNWPNSNQRQIEFDGPFPDTYDYNTLIAFAQKAIMDPTVVETLKINTGKPQISHKDYNHTEKYYTVHGYYGNGQKISLCLRGYEPYEWSSYGRSVQFDYFNEAKYYADRSPEKVVEVTITEYKIQKTIHVETETSTVKYVPNHVIEDLND